MEINRMEKKSFWKTNAGALTVAFIITIIGFTLILLGVNHGMYGLATGGFAAVVVAMLISPIKVFIIDRKN